MKQHRIAFSLLLLAGTAVGRDAVMPAAEEDLAQFDRLVGQQSKQEGTARVSDRANERLADRLVIESRKVRGGELSQGRASEISPNSSVKKESSRGPSLGSPASPNASSRVSPSSPSGDTSKGGSLSKGNSGSHPVGKNK